MAQDAVSIQRSEVKPVPSTLRLLISCSINIGETCVCGTRDDLSRSTAEYFVLGAEEDLLPMDHDWNHKGEREPMRRIRGELLSMGQTGPQARSQPSSFTACKDLVQSANLYRSDIETTVYMISYCSADNAQHVILA